MDPDAARPEPESPTEEPRPTEIPNAAPKLTLWQRIKVRWHKIAAWFSKFWSEVRPGAAAIRGGKWGIAVATLIAAIVGGQYLNSGFGRLADFLFVFAVIIVVFGISALLIPLALTVLRKLPRLTTAIVFGSLLIYSLAFNIPPLGLAIGAIACAALALIGGLIASLATGGIQQTTTRAKIVVAVLLVTAIAAVGGTLYFLANDGTLEGIVKAELKSPAPTPLQASNPGEPGPYKFRVVTYGAKGANPRRPEYDNPNIPTTTVDASRFFKDFKGWRASLRKKYWGYGMDKLPLNAIVWLPEGPGPFPLVLIVHGNHNMAEFSDPGYQYLGELLASRGFILATIDENFLNSGLFHDPPKQQAVRGWMLLEHLKLWRDWSKDPNNPLKTNIDFTKIALMGHSRGGEAAATAALFNTLAYYPDDAAIKFDYRFPIKSVVAIAPADGQYKPAGAPRMIEDVNYFTIQGANDADVSSFMGSPQFDRVKYPHGGDWFKSELYIYRANHGQFNTVWGRSDAGYPIGWFLNLKPLLDPENQRKIAKVYLSAFLEATLHEKKEYLPLFRDPRTVKAWLPDTYYINRYQDAAYQPLAEFSEDSDLTTTTLTGGKIAGADLSTWREGRIPFRRGDRGYNGVFLGWNHKGPDDKDDPRIRPEYSINLPETAKLNSATSLVLSVAALDQDAPRLHEDAKKDDAKKPADPNKKDEKKKDRESPDFTIEITLKDGTTTWHPLSDFGTVLPPLKVKFTKIGILDDIGYEKSSEPAFQTIAVPLKAFLPAGKPDIAQLKTIRLRFDRTPASVILISKIGFE